MSCGGAHAVRFAGYYPELIDCMFIDAPVINFHSFPGKIGNEYYEKVWKNEFLQAYPNMTRAKLFGFEHHPINMVETLIKNKIPVIMLYGTEDTTLPYNEHGAIMEQMYENHPELLKAIPRVGQGHHPHGLPDNPEIIVDFILKHIS